MNSLSMLLRLNKPQITYFFYFFKKIFNVLIHLTVCDQHANYVLVDCIAGVSVLMCSYWWLTTARSDMNILTTVSQWVTTSPLAVSRPEVSISHYKLHLHSLNFGLANHFVKIFIIVCSMSLHFVISLVLIYTVRSWAKTPRRQWCK